MMVACFHASRKRMGKNRNGSQRWRCLNCGKTWTEQQAKPLGTMTVSVDDAKLALRLLAEGSSLRSCARVTGLQRNTVCKLLVHFGKACRRFLDQRLRGLGVDHLECDEQWTFVRKKQARLTMDERAHRHDIGDVYLWTAVDQTTKLLLTYYIGKRSGDSARRFMLDIASRLVWPNPHASDDHAYNKGSFKRLVRFSTDAFVAYGEAIDLAFGPYSKWGTIVKTFRNARIVYEPSEMVGVKRTARRGILPHEVRTITTSHVERLNGTQRLMLKRLNRLTYCFSKKLRNLEAAFAVFAATYNFCWQTRMPGKSGKLRPTAAVMAGLADHTWTFDELFAAVLEPGTQF